MSGQRPFVKSISRGLSVLGRLCLILSLWHAPLPMIHAHGSDIEGPFSPSAAVEHLNQHHLDVAVNSHVEFGWHVHLVLLADPIVDEPYDEDGQPDHAPFYDPFVSCQATASPTVALEAERYVPFDWNAARVLSLTPIVTAARPTQFLGTYLDAVPLRTLLRVSRC